MRRWGAAWKGSREDGVCQISLRSDWIDWNWSACGNIVCAYLCVLFCVCALWQGCVFTSTRHILLDYKGHGNLLSQGLHWPSLYTPWLLQYTHTNVRGCVTWRVSRLLCLPVLTLSSEAEDNNTACFCQLHTVIHVLTCIWDSEGHWSHTLQQRYNKCLFACVFMDGGLFCHISKHCANRKDTNSANEYPLSPATMFKSIKKTKTKTMLILF